LALPETFTQFARTAAEQLRWKKARPLVEDELLTHLCDQRDALIAGGMNETAATAESLRLTGDPYEIGTELDRVHRPKTPTALFVLTAVIALSGLAFIVLVSFDDDTFAPFITHQCVALLLGTAAMLAAYFLDFTLLGRFALPLALIFHAALVLLSRLSRTTGGILLFQRWYIGTYVSLRCLPLLLPLMFALLLYALRGKKGWGVFAAFICLAVQCGFCLSIPAIADMIFIFLCDGVLLLFCAHANWFGLGKKRGIVLSSLPLGGCIVLSVPFNADRLAQQLTIMLDPYPYIKSGGYWTVILHELLENASFIGQGGVGTYSGQHFDRWGPYGIGSLQGHTLTLLVHRCGWLALIALAALLAVLLVLAFRHCRRQESMLARLVSYSVLLSFSAQAVASLLCDLTLLPFSAAAFPLFSFGIRTLLLDMTQLGFLLSTLRVGSVVRDKDVAAGPVRPKRRLRVSFRWENA